MRSYCHQNWFCGFVVVIVIVVLFRPGNDMSYLTLVAEIYFFLLCAT